jgi:transposase
MIDYYGRMQLRYSYRLDPTPGQAQSLARAFGCARVVFNDGLAARRAAFEAGKPYLPDAELSKRLTELKKTPERAWLAGVSSVVLQQALADLNTAYRNFFDSVNGKRKGPRVAPPRFRSRKDSRQAVRFTANARFKVLDNGRLRLPKVGDVAVRWSRPLPSAPSSVTVIKDAAGRLFASFVVEVTPQPLPETGRECGIDLGLGHFAVLDDGTKVSAPRFLRCAEKKLKRAQQAMSRKQKGSRNREKARIKVARAHAKVADARRDFSVDRTNERHAGTEVALAVLDRYTSMYPVQEVFACSMMSSGISGRSCFRGGGRSFRLAGLCRGWWWVRTGCRWRRSGGSWLISWRGTTARRRCGATRTACCAGGGG